MGEGGSGSVTVMRYVSNSSIGITNDDGKMSVLRKLTNDAVEKPEHRHYDGTSVQDK